MNVQVYFFTYYYVFKLQTVIKTTLIYLHIEIKGYIKEFSLKAQMYLYS